MTLLRFTPSFQYDDSDQALPFWIDYLGFRLVHDDGSGKLRVVERESLCVMLETNAEYAAQLASLIRVATDDIAAIWAEVHAKPRHHRYVHQRFERGPELRPWGAHEFAVQDHRVCIVFQQWPA
ncbi:MAG: VOC family protein [Planctomycetota bacterium]